jgi:hypothetical protein
VVKKFRLPTSALQSFNPFSALSVSAPIRAICGQKTPSFSFSPLPSLRFQNFRFSAFPLLVFLLLPSKTHEIPANDAFFESGPEFDIANGFH